MVEKPEYHRVIGEIHNINSWKEKVSGLTNEDWNMFLDRKTFPDQKDSDTILIHSLPDKESDIFSKLIKNDKMLDLFKHELEECYSLINSVYVDHEPKRVMLVKLPAKKSIKTHTDFGYHLENIHRIHLPIITNDNVIFKVNKTIVPMFSGSLVEINNNVLHRVDNNSYADRIHLIIDYGSKHDDYWR